MRRRDIPKILFAATTASQVQATTGKTEAHNCTPSHTRTEAEVSAGITPTHYEFSATNGVDVRRYMSSAQLQDFNKVNYTKCTGTDHCHDGTPTPTVDQSSALRAALKVCSAMTHWAPLIVPGKLYVTSTLMIDRHVDKMGSEFIIQGAGPQAGFYTDGNVTIFDSTLTCTTTPVSEFITFKDIRFETSSVFNASYVMSQAFLRVKFINCFFFIIRCLNARIYAQTWHFTSCNIRFTANPFLYAPGCYDISFIDNIIEGGNTLLKVDNDDNSGRGASGVRVIDNVIEGLQSSTLELTGCAGLYVVGNHIESNPAADIKLSAGKHELANHSVVLAGNYVFNPNGAWVYYGRTTTAVSVGNTVTKGDSHTRNAGLLHSNATQVNTLSSIGDSADGGVADAKIAGTSGAAILANDIRGQQCSTPRGPGDVRSTGAK